MATKREILREKRERVLELKRLLASTDYQAIKYSEGEITFEDYAPIREQRKAWRAEINALEAEIVELRNDN